MPGSERVLLDILEHDWKEAQADRQELCQKLSSLQNELQCAEQLRDKVRCCNFNPRHLSLEMHWNSHEILVPDISEQGMLVPWAKSRAPVKIFLDSGH